jgi:uncharacterized protein YjbI with pentapeptide repeats
MANEEQLGILKQGFEVWNEWRKRNPEVEIDLSRARLAGAYLSRANLSGADLKRANLFSASLTEASLIEADLRAADLKAATLIRTDLSDANLSKASLITADLRQSNILGANFSKADLRSSNLIQAIIRECDFTEADFTRAKLDDAVLSETRFIESNFTDASMHNTIFASSDLSEAIGLEDVTHWGPSIVSTGTFALSKGKLPDVFLRGCGLSDWEIASVKLYDPDLSYDEINEILYKMYDLRATQALQISPLFVSYSHADGAFVDLLESYLNEKGIRFWRDVHHATAGRLEKQIDRAMRLNPTVLLILSSNSIKSDWVEHEVRKARELEKEMVRDVLCPVALDDSWKSSPWPKRVMEQVMEYNILDFSAWEDDSKFEIKFRQLIDGLELFYKV